MKLLSNLKMPFVILFSGSIGGITYYTHLKNLKKIDLLEDKLYKKHQDLQKELHKSNDSFKDENFNPFIHFKL